MHGGGGRKTDKENSPSAVSLLAIGTGRYPEELKAYLQREIKLLAAGDINLSLVSSRLQNYLIYFWHWQRSQESGLSLTQVKDIVVQAASSAICDFIINFWEKDLIEEIVRHRYYYFTVPERRIIVQSTLKYIETAFNGSRQVECLRRRAYIYNRLLEFLSQNDFLLIEGFVRFRLRDYRKQLEAMVEQAVDEFFYEREMEEFVQLLRFFLELQTPRYQQVHIVNCGSSYRLLDENQQPVEGDFMQRVMFEMALDNSMSAEDLVLSVLVNVAPKEVIWHGERGEGVVAYLWTTVRQIFAQRFRECSGCPLCRQENS